MLFFFSRPWDKEKILSPREESNHRPSESALRRSTNQATEALWWARPITKFIYDTRPAHC